MAAGLWLQQYQSGPVSQFCPIGAAPFAAAAAAVALVAAGDGGLCPALAVVTVAVVAATLAAARIAAG